MATEIVELLDEAGRKSTCEVEGTRVLRVLSEPAREERRSWDDWYERHADVEHDQFVSDIQEEPYDGSDF